MRISIPREQAPDEHRVALTPDVAKRLIRGGHAIRIERDAGRAAGFLDSDYEAAGCEIVPDRQSALRDAELVAQIAITAPADLEGAAPGTTWVAFVWPVGHLDLVRRAIADKQTLFAMDLVPRITRAQSMDALSSMSTVAGYRSALLAAMHMGKFFPMLMTAAGTIKPARVLVIGAGVAGLQAIATAKRLGAIVEAYDIREEAREQARSVGAETIEVDLGEKGEGEGGYARELSDEAKAKLAAKLAERIRAADAVITTALVPGRPAPRLIDAATVKDMKAGAVIVDLAAETGGNCELTEPGQVVVKEDVTLVGLLNLPSSMAMDASRMYAKNIQEVVGHLTPGPAEGEDAGPVDGVHLDFDDDITKGAVLVHDGTVRHEPTRTALEQESA